MRENSFSGSYFGGINLWMEGYSATGEHGTAQYCGFYKVNTLKEAVEQWVNESLDRVKYTNIDHLTYWGCRFYDNEPDARKSFG